jgi:hypothetical protein
MSGIEPFRLATWLTALWFTLWAVVALFDRAPNWLRFAIGLVALAISATLLWGLLSPPPPGRW